MSALSVLVSAASWVAEGDEDIDLSSVEIGVGAFLAPLILGILVVFIGTSMARRLRRSNYRSEAREKIAAETAEQGGADPTPSAGGEKN